MESKRKNVYIGIFVITTIIASCLAVYLYITGNSENEKLQAKIDELNSTISKSEENSQVDEQQENTNVQEKVVEKAIIPKFDISKIKNKPDNITYTGNIMYSRVIDNLSITINNNGNVNLTVFEDATNSREIKVNGLNGKVIDACQGTLGDGANDAVVFLTENGDIYFADNVSSATNKYQGTGALNAKKVSSVSNICRIFWTMSSITDLGDRARATFIGIDTSGNCYDLWYEYSK